METLPPTSTPGASKKHDKAFSCVRCFDRKVKCTKQIPCTACTKAGVECVFRQPAPPRRRKKRTQEELLLTRLKRCEDLLKSHGLSPDSSQNQQEEPTQDPDTAAYEASLGSGALSRYYSSMKKQSSAPMASLDAQVKDSGKLLTEDGKTKYFENSLYSGLNDELRASDDMLQASSEDDIDESVIACTDAATFANGPQSTDFIMGLSPTNASLISLHPSPDQIYKLWQVYLDNINPLTKIIHQPTLQSAIFDASFNLDKVDKGLEALMFAIYASATYSMTEKECTDMLREEKTNLLGRFRLGLRKALVRANFLATSEFMVVQAFTIYLVSMRMLYEGRTMWILAGIANRLGQSLGLHRDGTTLGLPPFESEMRRRLWWQIIILDSRSAELAGSARTFDLRGWDIKVPANVNDADLYPQMTQAPVSKYDKATEMISCSLRYELGDFLRQSKVMARNGFDGDWQFCNPQVSKAEKDQVITQIEQRFEEKYVRYCDPSIPIHFHTMIVARSAIHAMRLMAHHPRHQSEEDCILSPEELDTNFTLALKGLETDNICHSSPVFQRFLWHSHTYFNWQSLIYLLSALRTRTEGPEVDTAWQQIEEMYIHHPTFVSDTKRPLHVATGGLCLKAWQVREAALARLGMTTFPPTTPAFIQTLRRQLSRKAQPARDVPVNNMSGSSFVATPQANIGDFFSPSYQNTNPNTSMIFGENGEFEANMLADFSMEDVSPMNWDEWDSLVNGYGVSQAHDWTDLPGLSG